MYIQRIYCSSNDLSRVPGRHRRQPFNYVEVRSFVCSSNEKEEEMNGNEKNESDVIIVLDVFRSYVINFSIVYLCIIDGIREAERENERERKMQIGVECHRSNWHGSKEDDHHHFPPRDALIVRHLTNGSIIIEK